MSSTDAGDIGRSPFLGRTVPGPLDWIVSRLIEDQANSRPDAPAVLFGARTLTYRQLNGRANALVSELRRSGVGRGDIVPLVMDNGPELPIAMLALLKLAAPFVPMDRLWPHKHLRDLLRALAPRIVLYSGDAHPPLTGQSWHAVSADGLAECVIDGCGEQARPGDIAYGFYTSGSTGVPKCALNLHRGLLNRFLYMSRRFGAWPQEIVLQNSRHTFDSSLWQLLWPLTNGARVVIPPPTDALDLMATVEMIERYQVTMTDFVPSVFNVLVELVDARPELADRLTSLRRLLIGGEAINPEAVQIFRLMLPQVTITNTYGPTEASIGSIFHDVTDADGRTIPIGRPIDNTFAVVLDDQMRPVGPGETGEIHIGGVCLGAGYLNDPERTRLAFVPNPFAEIPGERLYRTGDLGYVDYDDRLHFVGRFDEQVKIGGVRVELAEVEHALLAHPQVRQAKVVVIERDGTKVLMAFVTGRDVAVNKLAADIRAVLPSYLVPGRFSVLERLPLLPNGKTDRCALIRLAFQCRDELPRDGETSRDAVEELVCQAWQQVLPGPPPGPDDDFFDQGGDSLTAQRLAIALQTAVGVPYSVRDVIQAPTPSGQAARLRGQACAQSSPEARLHADLLLPDDIQVRDGTGPPVRPLQHVLLTGATGFLGAQLVHDLVRRGCGTVHCLVRAADQAGAQRRLVENLTRYRLWTADLINRVVAVPGDVSHPWLGLTEVDHYRLTTTADTVVHAAALVNLVRSYPAHRCANVVGTIEILRFAAQGQVKPVHFVSTLGVLPAAARSGASCFVEAPAGDAVPHDGYSQSKWVAEGLLRLAKQRGIPGTVYRLGEVMPHSQHGVPNPRGLVDLIVQTCLRVRLCFTSPIVMDYTPVDFVGGLVAAAVTRGKRGYFHVQAPRPVPLDELLGAFRESAGLRSVAYPDFWRAVQSEYDCHPGDQTLGGLLAALPPPDETGAAADHRLGGLFLDGTSSYSTERARELCTDTGVSWPEVDRAVFGRYVAYHLGS